MTVLSIAAIVVAITFITIITKYFALALITGAAWIFLGYYINQNPPWGLVAGSVGMNMLMGIMGGMAIGMPGYIILYTGRDKGSGVWESNGEDEEEARKFNVRRFLTNGDTGNRSIPKKRRIDRYAEHEARIEAALHPRKRRR